MKNTLLNCLSVFLATCFCSITEPKQSKFEVVPINLEEISGISYSAGDRLIWAIEDSGNQNKLFGINSSGKVVRSIEIKNATNNDWEDLTADKKGNLYIGDFGNNKNLRKDLCILKINQSNLKDSSIVPDYKVSFFYPEQTDFPPKKKEMYFDCEAFIAVNNSFYLFTKNRSKNFDGISMIYKIPNKPGYHRAKLVGKFKSCNKFETCAITSATISSNGKKLLLLCHDKIWLFQNFKADHFTNGEIHELSLPNNSQKEAICFKDSETIFVAAEKSKKKDARLYRFNLSTLKIKS